VGEEVGVPVDAAVGYIVGFAVGFAVGLAVGFFVGFPVGFAVGTLVGVAVGAFCTGLQQTLKYLLAGTALLETSSMQNRPAGSWAAFATVLVPETKGEVQVDVVHTCVLPQRGLPLLLGVEALYWQ
jgi:hypothetical protein